MRSKKLSRLIFYVVAVGASATLRLNPQLVNEIANYFAEPSQATQVALSQKCAYRCNSQHYA